MGFIAERYDKIPLVILFHGRDGLEQRENRSPIDVVTYGVLENLQQGVAVMIVEMFRSLCRMHGAPSSMANYSR